MAAMKIGYGNFRHPAGWANLLSYGLESTHFSPRGFREYVTVTAHVQGDIVLSSGETEYDLDSYISQMNTAFSVDGLDWGLYHSDGTATPHYLWSNDPSSLTGNQFLFRTFPASHGGEYASGREFEYKIRNIFAAQETSLIDFFEQIEQTGTCGPGIVWKNGDRFNPPYYEYKSTATLQYTIQRGHAISMDGFMIPPVPLFGAPYEIGHMRKITRTSPRRYPQGYREYRVDWEYHYFSDTPLLAMPGAS